MNAMKPLLAMLCGILSVVALTGVFAPGARAEVSVYAASGGASEGRRGHQRASRDSGRGGHQRASRGSARGEHQRSSRGSARGGHQNPRRDNIRGGYQHRRGNDVRGGYAGRDGRQFRRDGRRYQNSPEHRVQVLACRPVYRRTYDRNGREVAVRETRCETRFGGPFVRH